MEIALADETGQLATYRLTAAPQHPEARARRFNRTVPAAVHVVADPVRDYRTVRVGGD